MPVSKYYQQQQPNATSASEDWDYFATLPSSTGNLRYKSREIMCLGDGTLEVFHPVRKDWEVVDVTAGVRIPFVVDDIRASGTTATGIYVFY